MRYAIASAVLALAAVPVLAQIPNTAGMPGAATPTRVAAGTYQVDPAHTQVGWEVNHMGFSMLEGMFPVSAGSITVDPKNVAATKLDVTIAVADVAVTSTAFANHLKTDQIFDTAKFPTAKFVSTSVKAAGANKATVTGNLTIKGVTKPVTLDATFIGAGANPMSKKLNFGFGATTTIKRSEFGLGIAVPVVSDDVKLHIHAAFTAA